ncbi:DEAD/DEAH box helicase family protein, partial [bacterium]|nr:DEAD/DEAH box helicase family protein [bacterium]
MADGTTKIGNGSGTNGVNGNGVDPQMWRDVHHAMETQAIPSLGLLRQLRSLLFKEDPDRNRSTSIAKLLGGTQGPALDEEAAWGVLQEWMEELEIDIEEIHARAELTSDELTFEPVEGTGEVEHQEEAVVGDAFEAAPDEGVAQTTPAVSSDLAALQRSAQRFADVDRIKPIQTSFDSVAEKIESRISLWGARYGEVSEYHKEEIDERLETLKRNFGEATSHDDMQYAEDLKDALKILWNRILRIEREMFATELKSVNPFKVSLFSYKDEISKSKIQDPRSKIVSTTRTVTRAREKEGTRIAALVSKHKSGMAIDLRDHQWDMMKAIQLDWGSHEDAIRRGGRRDLWRSSVIVAPTGSGKTRVMASSIELGIREGWLRFDKSDKVFIETHLKEIKTQNVNSMQQLLNPVFREIYGRDVRITVISGESKTWDVSGDVVVVSVPTIGRKAGDQKLIAELNGSVTNALILQDEYHHAAAASWQRTTDAIMHACGRGYVMGFTATLPLSERAGSNIIYENTARNLMNKLVLPAMELVQVRTGVDLQRIPTVGGDFNLRELSQTVRNLERYEHTMRALEFNGVRNGKGGMASTLIFTVDTLHAEETAAYYQMYFAKQRENYDLIPGEVVEALPKRNIAVINGRMKETEIDKLIAARRYNSEAEYDIYSHDGGFITSGRNRAKIDGMVAVITGNTPTHIRKKLINASRAGLVECLINIKVFGEGFDGWWIQNLVGARPALVSANTKMIQRAQEIGRIMRYGPDEIDKSGLLKRAPRRRVAIDLIDNTSVRRPLVTYLDVLGISSELEREFGKKIDVASDGISGNAYGGLKDIYDTSGEGTPRKRELDLPETIEMRNVFGEREHWLYPEEYVGPLAQELRRIWGIKYHGNLKELAADLAVSEEMLVGYFNMSVPADDRVIKRMATFLYKGRMD